MTPDLDADRPDGGETPSPSHADRRSPGDPPPPGDPGAGDPAAGHPPPPDAAGGTPVLGGTVVAAHAPGPSGTGPRPVHRLRELSPRGRLVAAAFFLALVATPLVAFAQFAPDWVPGGDNALMGLRALDVGTVRTPLVGQPSTSGLYGGEETHAYHPGAVHFYLMAPFVRLLGLPIGMLVVSIAITGGSVLIAAWAAFRQLGVAGGVLAAVVLDLVMFTTGSTSLVTPVSSNIAGYPVLCGAVLVWCLLCGDDRLLPLATGALSFAVLQHLSVAPTIAVLGVAAAVGVVLRWRRTGAWADPTRRRALTRLLWLSAAVAALLWLTPVYEQVNRMLHGERGNLSALVGFTSDSGRDSVGVRGGADQVVRALGLPPMLGRTQPAQALSEPVPAVTLLTAALVVVALVAVGYRWRSDRPRRSLLAAMAGVMAVAGLVTSSNVPDSMERYRIAFYHWMWPLAFFAVMALALWAGSRLGPLAARTVARAPRLAPAGALGVALVAMVVPTALNPGLDRLTNLSNRAGSPYERSVYDSLVDQVLDHRDELSSPVLVLSRGERGFSGAGEAFALRLVEEGIGVVYPGSFRSYVADEHLVDTETVESALVVVTERPGVPLPEVSGREVGQVDLGSGFAYQAHDQLVAELAGAGAVAYGPELDDLLARLDAETRDQVERTLQDLVGPAGANLLLDPDAVQFLLDYPLARPRLDPALLADVRDSLPPVGGGAPVVALRVRLVTGDDLDALLGR